MTRDKLKLLANAPLVIELEDLGTEATSCFSDDLPPRPLSQPRLHRQLDPKPLLP